MSIETIITTIERLRKEFPDRNRIVISLTSTGEPTLNLETIYALRSEYPINSNAPLQFRFNFSTNTSLLKDDDLDKILSDPRQDLFVSYDGEIHDSIRKNKSGEGDSWKTLKVLKKITTIPLDDYQIVGVSTVLTNKHKSLIPISNLLLDLGVSYWVTRPVRGSQCSNLKLDEKNVNLFIRAYEELGSIICDEIKNGDYQRCLQILNRYDFLGKRISALILGEPIFFGCPSIPTGDRHVSAYVLAVDVDGDVYFPCRDFVGDKRFFIGSIENKLELNKVEEVIGARATDIFEKCNKCWARKICGGGCYNAAYIATNTLTPTNSYCQLIEAVTKQALYIAGSISLLKGSDQHIFIDKIKLVSPWPYED